MNADDDLDDVWGKLTDAEAPPEEPDEEIVDFGAPVRVTFVIKSDHVPVAPWAQGWRVGALGPDEDGHVTLICEHDIDMSPVAQLAAVTGLLGTIKNSKLDLVWWAVQTRGPLPGEHPDTGTDDIDQELRELLGSDDETKSDLDELDS